MIIRTKFALTFVCLNFSYLVHANIIQEETEYSSTRIPTYNPTCKFYLAESSIPNAGFGIYTVESIRKHDFLTEVPDAPSVIVTDESWNSPGSVSRSNFNDYYWDGSGQGEYEADDVNESVVTFGSLCNFHTYLHNIKPYAIGYDDSITTRSSPGIGAFSYHPGFHFRAGRDIDEGEEIFAYYGPTWLEARELKIPNKKDFNTASEVVLKILNHLEDTKDLGFLKILKEVVGYFSPKASTVVPEDISMLERIVEKLQGIENHTQMNTPQTSKNFKRDIVARMLADETITVRTLDWIKTKGQCLDNLVPQISTLPHAGRGAFAQRMIAKGHLVVPAPLLMVMDQSDMNIYDITIEEGKRKKSKVGHQLLMNYCFSHPHSAMALCPQTNAILINHCSTRKSYGGHCEKYNNNRDPTLHGANAEIRWVTTWDPNTVEWLKMSYEDIKELVYARKRGLSLEIIATRDIHPGEEVFIDYGEEWETAWDEHIKNFEPPSEEEEEGELLVSVSEMNQMDILRTSEELDEYPMPDNVQLTCVYWMEDGEESDSGLYYEAEEWVTDGSIYGKETEEYHMHGIEWPCAVIHRNETSNTYTVEIFEKRTETLWGYHNMRRILSNYPRDSMRFMPAAYTSDQHFPGAFRKFIGIRDELFPVNWRNLLMPEEFDEEESQDEL